MTTTTSSATAPLSEGAQFRRALRHDGPRLVLVLVLAIAVATGVGLLLVHVLDSTAVGRFDVRTERWFADHRTPRLNRFTGDATWMAESIPVAILSVTTLAVAWFATKRWVAPVFVLVAIGGEKLTYFVTQLLVDRPRPPVQSEGHVYNAGSFPSGHTGSAVALYGSIVVLLIWTGLLRRPSTKFLAGVLVALIAVTVAYARMYRGQHHPTDVAAGALIGLFWLLLSRHMFLVPNAYRPRDRRAMPDDVVLAEEAPAASWPATDPALGTPPPDLVPPYLGTAPAPGRVPAGTGPVTPTPRR